MKKLVFLLPVIMLLASCYPKQQWQKDAIGKKEKALVIQKRSGRIDTTTLNALLSDYQNYAAKYPTDTTGAEFLFNAADFYRYKKQPTKSIEIYGKVYANYPTLVKRPYALFLQGFTYENELNDLESARIKYQQFLETYPTHPFARDVRAAMNSLGKTPEQLIQEFESRADSTAQTGK